MLTLFSLVELFGIFLSTITRPITHGNITVIQNQLKTRLTNNLACEVVEEFETRGLGCRISDEFQGEKALCGGDSSEGGTTELTQACSICIRAVKQL